MSRSLCGSQDCLSQDKTLRKAFLFSSGSRLNKSIMKCDGPLAGLIESSAEFSAGFSPRRDIRHVLFDFDGTLSLIRQGWPEVMVAMFVEALPRRSSETDADLERLVHEDIMRLNGRQTIYQMMQLAQRVAERGGVPREPLWYKREYLRRLDAAIAHRVEGLKSGRTRPDELLVHGSRPLLELLCARGFTVYLASGTDEPFVRAESELLDLARYFGPRIYGRKTTTVASPSNWSSSAFFTKTRSPANNCCHLAMATWKSKIRRPSAAWRSPWPATRRITAPGGWTPGSGSGCWASARTW